MTEDIPLQILLRSYAAGFAVGCLLSFSYILVASQSRHGSSSADGT